MTVTEIGIDLPSTGVDDRERFSRGISSVDGRSTTWGLLSLDLSLAPVPDDLGDEDLVLPGLSLERREDGVAGCFMVDLSKLLHVNNKERNNKKQKHTRDSVSSAFPVNSHSELGHTRPSSRSV